MNEQDKLVSKIILFLFLIVGFVPSFKTLDVVSAQWLYVSIVNFVAIGYFFYFRKRFDFSVKGKVILVFSGIYLGFFIAACLSTINAIVISESIIGLSRLFTLLIAFSIMYFIIKDKPKEYFKFFVILILGVLSVELFEIITYFVANNNSPRSSELIGKFTHNYGNINIYAASIVMKFPFAIYGFINYKGLGKYIASLILGFTIVAIFFLGARTAAFSSALILVVLSFFYIFKKNKSFVVNLKTIILPLITLTVFAVLFSVNTNRIYKGSLNSIKDIFFPKKISKLYEETSEISLTRGSGRKVFWETALNDFKTHPVLGVGIGNWKMYSKTNILKLYTGNKYKYPKRVHNDFIQTLTEIGIVGFLFYLMAIGFISYIILKGILKRKDSDEELIFVVLGLSFLAYNIDAFFNFPHERTPIQILIFVVMAFIVALYSSEQKKYSKKYTFRFVVLFLITSLVSIAINYQVFKSSQVQRIMFDNYVGKDLLKAKYNVSYNEIMNKLPDFPVINEIGRPIEHSKAMFAYSEGKYNLAMKHLNKSMQIAPEQIEHMGLKAILFYKELNNQDSAFYYAKKVFDIFPAVKANLTIVKKHYADKKDTANVFKTINTFLKQVPMDVDEWINKAKYIKFYYNDSKRALEVIDSAILLNPNNKKIKEYKTDKFKINSKRQVKKATVSNKNLEAENKFIKEHYDLAMKYFNNKQHQKAKAEFDKVLHVRPNNNANLINLALVEIKLKNYKKAIQHLDKVIASNFMNNGQPEYNRGLCYLKLGNKVKAAEDFRSSKAKGYPKALKLKASLLK